MAKTFLIILASVVSLPVFGNQVDLPSDRRCDLRRTLCSVWWKPCRDEVESAREARVRRCRGLWGVADSGLNAQCLRSERFLRVNSFRTDLKDF